MLALDRRRARLAGFVAGEEDGPACSFCVALKHDVTRWLAACGEGARIDRIAAEIEPRAVSKRCGVAENAVAGIGVIS